jgi:hypothetical protein
LVLWGTYATVVGGAAAGLTGLLFNVGAGLDVLVLPAFVGLAGGVVSAWLLLTKIPE